MNVKKKKRKRRRKMIDKILDKIGWMCVDDNPITSIVGIHLAFLVVIGGASAYFLTLAALFGVLL